MRMVNFLMLFSLIGIARDAYAGRTVIAPPYLRRIIFTFDSPVPTSGQAIGAMMKVQIVLTNLSSIDQTGTITLMAGTSAWAGQVGRPVAKIRKILCGLTSSGANTGEPSPVTFKIAANGTSTIEIWSFITSIYNPAGPGGNTLFDSSFTPIVQIQVDQDRGAINGTMIPLWDGPVSGLSLCDGTSLSGYQSGLTASESRTGVPLLINGGRPF